MQKTTRQWQIQDLESFDSKMVALSIFNEIWKRFVVFAYERDVSCYIFQNINLTNAKSFTRI